jgi:hypothetical protein
VLTDRESLNVRSYEGRFEPTTAERIADNERRFREAHRRARHGATRFVCECADPMCRKLVALTLEEYAEVRREPTHSFSVPGHETMAGGLARTVAERNGYLIVERSSLPAPAPGDWGVPKAI